MSSDLYSSHFTMLRATVLLCLVTSAVLTQSLAITDTTQSNDPIDDGTIVDYLSDSQLRDDGSINDTLSRLSGLPVCSTDYSRMSIANRKMIQQISSKPFLFASDTMDTSLLLLITLIFRISTV